MDKPVPDFSGHEKQIALFVLPHFTIVCAVAKWQLCSAMRETLLFARFPEQDALFYQYLTFTGDAM